MDLMAVLIPVLLSLLPIILLACTRKGSSKRLPPGSLGIPIIGQSFALLRAMRTNTAEKWLQERAQKYGPISKLTLFGKPTVFIHGQAANKLIFSGDSTVIASQQAQSFKRIWGDRNILELSGEDHKRVRNALVSFLKPESLRQYVGRMDEEIRKQIELHWQGKQNVRVLPSMKHLTFNIICSLLFGLERGAERDKYLQSFQEMVEGTWSVPINLPFTRYRRSLHASKRVQTMLKALLQEKRMKLEEKIATPRQDLITCLLSIHDEQGKQVLTEEEIMQNVTLLMVAGSDTSSVLITFMIRLMLIEPAVYAAVLHEQENIAKNKQKGEPLTWEDLSGMKCTWRVAMETLRMFPPVFGTFRTALKDIEYGGYIIPEGWQIFWASNMTHMDDALFREPSKFDPSRYENPAAIPPYCFVAFGGGPRICPGNEFARIETLVSMHYLTTQFSMKLQSDPSFIRDLMPVPSQGLLVEIQPKKLH